MTDDLDEEEFKRRWRALRGSPDAKQQRKALEEAFFASVRGKQDARLAAKMKAWDEAKQRRHEARRQRLEQIAERQRQWAAQPGPTPFTRVVALVIVFVGLLALVSFASTFIHGLDGTLIYGVKCGLNSCPVSHSRADEPISYFLSMAVHLIGAGFSGLCLLGGVLVSLDSRQPPESREP